MPRSEPRHSGAERFDRTALREVGHGGKARATGVPRKSDKLRLERKSVVRVVGKAFYHAVHGKKSTPNRGKHNRFLTVWFD